MKNTLKNMPRSTIWEAIAISIGAIALIGFATIGLGLKAWNNAMDPKRARAIASNIIEYQLPGVSKGVFGIHIGGLKMAQVNSYDPKDKNQTIPEVELIVARVLLDNKKNLPDVSEALDPWENPLTFPYYQQDEFKTETETVVNKKLCGQQVPVTIQEGTLIVNNNNDQGLISALRYSARIEFSDHQFLVKITSTSPNAQEKADEVLNSIQCL